MPYKVVEDALKVVPSRFDLVVFAAARAKALERGSPALVAPGRHKSVMVALKEIAEGKISVEDLRENAIKQYQKNRDTANEKSAEEDMREIFAQKHQKNRDIAREELEEEEEEELIENKEETY